MTTRAALLVALLTFPVVAACGKKSVASKDVAALEQACESDGQACAELSTRYQEGCDQNDARSCNGLARMHFEGAFVPQDKDKAVELFERACAGGYAPACANLSQLAGLYAQGSGVPVDTARAAALYQKSCAGGVTEACAMAKELPSPASK
jgi:TPR repeat protein